MTDGSAPTARTYAPIAATRPELGDKSGETEQPGGTEHPGGDERDVLARDGE